MLLSYFMILLIMLMSVAFFTIMERKILGSIHIRLGPSKLGFMGIMQPFSDAIKLFSKNMSLSSKMNEAYWNLSPNLTFLIFIIITMFIPIKMENNMIFNNTMFMLFIFGLTNFTIFWSSFFSFNKFSIISSKRCVSQLISYEMGLVFFFISMIFIFKLLNNEDILKFADKIKFNKLIMMIIMFILVLSESSRTPFDFIEGESELVSGFNIEYSSSYFSLFFIYEYGMMLFFSILLSMFMINFLFSFLLIFFFICIRSCFLRIRYDQMMILIWKFIYPIMMNFMIFMKYF